MENIEMTTPESRKREEQEEEQMGVNYLTYILFNEEKTPIAFTEITYDEKDEPTLVRQLYTGVTQSMQGKGLAKAIKAYLILTLRKKYPKIETVLTCTSIMNDKMENINKKLGFRQKNWSIIYKITLRDLLDKLN